MEPVTSSSPILLVPFWTATVPLMTISLLAKDFYNVSLWFHPNNQNCQQAYETRTLQLVKWKWLWLESSHWLHWKYSYPGSYCITTTPFSCENCQPQVWGEFHVPHDTSLGGLCCYDRMISLKMTSAEPHRYDPVKKSVQLKLELGMENTCRTRFHVQILDADPANCREDKISSVQMMAADELIAWNDRAFHDIPVNSSRICARIIPWCDACAFTCLASLHLVELETEKRENPTELGRRSFPLLNFICVWLTMTLITSFIILELTRRKRVLINRISLVPGQFSVIDFD